MRAIFRTVCFLGLILSTDAFAQGAVKSRSLTPSPVRDLDARPVVPMDGRDAAAARDLACALMRTSRAGDESIKNAQIAMRQSAEAGDHKAELYFAKFLHAGYVPGRDAGAAHAHIRNYLARELDDVRDGAQASSIISATTDALNSAECGPAMKISTGDVIVLAPPPGLRSVPQAKTLIAGRGGFLDLQHSPATDRVFEQAARLGSASHARDQACRLFKAATGKPELEQEAYIYMRTAADCGDEVAAMYTSAFLRAGRGAEKNEDRANDLLRRTIKYLWRYAGYVTSNEASAALRAGECAPPDEYGSRKIAEMPLDRI